MEENTKEKQKPPAGKVSLISLAGLVTGALGGYLYYLKIGCVSGSCAITSNPWMSTIWGALLGYLIFDLFKGMKFRKKEKQPE